MNLKKGGVLIKGKVEQRIRWRIREQGGQKEERDDVFFHLNIRWGKAPM